jgi:hypothetical protein
MVEILRGGFGVSKVSRERDWDIVEEKTRNEEEATHGRTGDFPSSCETTR